MGAAFGVSAIAVVVSAAGGYLAWRRTKAAEGQLRLAGRAVDRQESAERLARRPRLFVEVESIAVDRHMRALRTALALTIDGPADYAHVGVRIGEPVPGLLGFRTGGAPAAATQLGRFPAGERRRIPIAVVAGLVAVVAAVVAILLLTR